VSNERSVSERRDPLDRLGPEFRAQVEEFAQKLGARITHVGPRGARDPRMPRDAAVGWEQWLRRCHSEIFAAARTTVEEREAMVARKKERARAWLEYWRMIGRNWARWCRWYESDRGAAERYRSEHAGPDGDDACWLKEFGKFRVPGRPRQKTAKGGMT
jgi:hypothetical protein